MILRDKNSCIMVQEGDEAMFADAIQSHREEAEKELSEPKSVRSSDEKVDKIAPPSGVVKKRFTVSESVSPPEAPSDERPKERVVRKPVYDKTGAVRNAAGSSETEDEIPQTADSDWVRSLVGSNEVIAGLVLWEEQAVAAVLEHHKGSTVLKQAGQVVFPKNATDAERSRILKKWWRSSRFCTRSVWAGFHTSSDIQKYFSLPVDESGLRDALMLEAEESLQVESPNALMDYYLFEKEKKDDPSTGMMFATPRWSVMRYKKILDDAGLLVCGIGVPNVEIARTFRWLGMPVSPQFADCVLFLTETSANIVIVCGNSSLYSRTVESASGGWETNLDYLVQALNDAFMYFQLYLSTFPVGRIQLTGHFPEHIDLTGFLLMETGLVVRQWDPLAETGKLYCSPKLAASAPDLLAGCLGLALRRD
jgi:Tfp pilus assembly PilM family ATPase